MTCYIYAIVDPTSKQIVYVGKTIKNINFRMSQHLRDARNGRKTPLCYWLSKIIANGLIPAVIVLQENPSDWQQSEKDWITHCRSINPNLKNICDGGQGGYSGWWDSIDDAKRILIKSAISEGKKRWLNQTNSEQRSNVSKKSFATRYKSASKEEISAAQGIIGKKCWAGLSKEERSEKAKVMASKRKTYACGDCKLKTNAGSLAKHHLGSGHSGRTQM